ncbi:MAG: TAT-variant-translocated molybdopterin oxidoreductase [Roseibacillus sp.]|nr:TAT-variant-translocated molybdopterin oxidoreductase [Roseibacillus sp.]
MSKRVFHHPEVSADDSGVASWRSVGELERTPSFRAHVEREFPEGSGHLSPEDQKATRRSFMKLMGASSALSGLTLVSCRRPESYIVPYKKAPEWVIPGKPLYYASTRPRAEGSVPLVVTTYEGRPTTLAPNGDHNDGCGADALTQASVLNLYDPKRSRNFLRDGKKASQRDFEGVLGSLAREGAKLAVVVGEDDSPTRNRLRDEIVQAYPESKFYTYEALCGEARRRVQNEVFGEGSQTVVDFSKAERILSLDCDFLGVDPVGSASDFSRKRQGGGETYHQDVAADAMNRLYMVESVFSLTGGMADHRLRAKPSQMAAIAAQVAIGLGITVDGYDAGCLSDEEKAELLGTAATFDSWILECVADLKAHKGSAVVLAGSRHEEDLQRIVIAINREIGSYGGPMVVYETGRTGYGTIADFEADVDEETIVLLLGPSNPVYDRPGEQFRRGLSRSKLSIHLGVRTDATALACDWHIPAAHYLESWGDTRTATGTYSLTQPMILPLYGGFSELEILSQLLSWRQFDWDSLESEGAEEQVVPPTLIAGEGMGGAPSPALAEVRQTFSLPENANDDGDVAWKEALKGGYLQSSSYQTVDADGAGDPTPKLSSRENTGIEINLLPDASVWDGRYIDNGWLQEAPDPISKLSWDNAALVSPKTAKELGVYESVEQLEPETEIPLLGKVKNAPQPSIGEGKGAKAPMALIKTRSGRMEIPVLVAFGHADDCISIALGYGQGASDGRDGVRVVREEDPLATVSPVGINTGFNANQLRGDASFSIEAIEVTKTQGRYPVALVQEHNAMNGRALAREISTNDVEHHGHKVSFEDQVAKVREQGPVDSHAPENVSLYKRRGSTTWEGDKDKQDDLISDKIHQWGMTIDLNTCVGCNACLIACQAENNIPIVGKEQVAMGREMHWVRMDRYFASPMTEMDEKTHKKIATPDWVQQNPEMIPQPVSCMQCENAPCETVCPVNATVHSEEGLNTMAYNRCIGTRYCANNCPYKARRFNYFDYNKRNPLVAHNLYKGPFGKKQVGEAPHLQRNPNVSVRMRGVMEKCTYCVQRLESAKIKQKQIGRMKTLQAGRKSTDVQIKPEDLRVKADSIKVACQDACEANAVSFGNLLDKEDAQVWRAKYKGEKKTKSGAFELVHNPRNYDVLQYIGTAPRTSYLARVKNPNPTMPDAVYRGLATINTA